MPKLLNIDANAKTVKGQARGYMTAVLYLAPHNAADDRTVCPMADIAQCAAGCLNTAGRGGIAKAGAIIATDRGTLPDNAIQRARIARTRLYWDDREAFMAQLVKEIDAFILKAKRAGLIPVVRLNGTSDIQWERGHDVLRLSDGAREAIKRSPKATLKGAGRTLAIRYTSIFAAFPDVQFYDYTKMPKRFERTMPNNYHLSLSFSGASADYADKCWTAHKRYDAPLVFVVRTKAMKAEVEAMNTGDHGQVGQAIHGPFVDGDETDLRFTDPLAARVYLYAKGRARHDDSGFVLDI